MMDLYRYYIWNSIEKRVEEISSRDYEMVMRGIALRETVPLIAEMLEGVILIKFYWPAYERVPERKRADKREGQ